MTETVILAAGCFWGVQDILRKIPGVQQTEVGYAGGDAASAYYSKVKMGSTDHAEAVRVVFDPNKISFLGLLDYFFRLHDPTTENRQGNDVGTQYRSVIFCQNADQKIMAEQKVKEVEASGRWPQPLVTQVVDGQGFFSAEDYHQDYLVKNPNGYTCHFLRP